MKTFHSIQIKQVYLAAWQLRMEQVVNQCAAHLVKDLSLETSLETRSLPGINRNKDFVGKVDQFITEHVSF
jgi:influenza virus NS1A-binding protein